MEKEKWISVDEKLPKKNEYVIVYRPESINIAQCIKRNPITFDNPDWFCSTKNVTHWMPLPEPPK